jgi:hypothetical protein
MNAPARITDAEVAQITDANAHLFIARHVNDYWPCEINSRKITNFIESQVGEDYSYPWPIEFFENAFSYLVEHDFLLPRPVEEVTEDPAVTRERLAQHTVRDDHATRVEADKIARAKTIPLAQLGSEIALQNNQFREQRDRNELPTRTPGLESRPLSTVKLGDKATARANVALAHPSLDRNSSEFAKLYAAELSRLRG